MTLRTGLIYHSREDFCYEKRGHSICLCRCTGQARRATSPLRIIIFNVDGGKSVIYDAGLGHLRHSDVSLYAD
jgi:hypothetical protein